MESSHGLGFSPQLFPRFVLILIRIFKSFGQQATLPPHQGPISLSLFLSILDELSLKRTLKDI